jgi:hypothetical protein
MHRLACLDRPSPESAPGRLVGDSIARNWHATYSGSGLDRRSDLFGCQPGDRIPGLDDWCAKRGGTCHYGDGAGTR